MKMDQAQLSQVFENRKKIQPYDERGNHDSYLRCFGEATNAWPEEMQIFELKNAFKFISCPVLSKRPFRDYGQKVKTKL